MLLMSYVKQNETKSEDAWFLDWGCDNHMRGDKALFSDLNESCVVSRPRMRQSYAWRQSLL